ncbi:MAG: ABC transporter permease, partial [Cetobacterium sp.]
MDRMQKFLQKNIVPLFILFFLILIVPISKLTLNYLLQEMILRLNRNLFLVLSLLIPIIAGMGLNFGIVLGAMAGQIALIFITEWRIVGYQGVFLAMILSAPIAMLLGYFSGNILNKAKG